MDNDLMVDIEFGLGASRPKRSSGFAWRRSSEMRALAQLLECVKRLGLFIYIFEDRRRSSEVAISPLASRNHRINQ
jgi:hypothetical protein